MAEALLDAKFWNKVFKLLKPATVVAVKKNKGAGKNQLIPSNGCVNLNRSDNKKGFFYRYMNKHKGSIFLDPSIWTSKQRLERIKVYVWGNGLTEARVKEIEKAIVQAAATENLLPESVRYDGKPVFQARKRPERSTIEFGFVYFVRNDEIYKIGITDNLLRRMKEVNPDELLNTVRCGNYQEIEKTMHAHFKKRRIPQTEYFRLDAAEVEEAHSLMTDLADFKGR